MNLLQWIFSPCHFRHETRVWERVPGKGWVLVCPRCRATHVVRLVMP
jgi:hypothetical protein